MPHTEPTETRKTINGYKITVSSGFYDPVEKSFGSYGGREGMVPGWGVSISNKWHYIEGLHPFDTEDDAWKAARKWTNANKPNRLLR